MTALKLKIGLGLLVGLLTAGAVAYSTGAVPAVAEGGQAGAQPGAPAAKVKIVRVPAPQDGILLAVGTVLEKGGPAVEPSRMLKVRVGKEVREYRRLRVGDKVEEGQMLAQLDDRPVRNEVAIKRAKVEAAKADHLGSIAMHKEAQARLDRLDNLHKTNPRLISSEEYSGAILTRDKHREEAVSKGQMVRVAELELRQAETTLESSTIRSPVSGVLRRIHKHRGEAVRSLETLFEIQIADED